MKQSIVLLATICLLSSAAGCSNRPDGEVSVQSVSMICGIGPVGMADRFAGVVSPRSETDIKRDEEKTISEVKVQVGDEVTADQVLFVYDSDQAQLNLEKAQLELEQLNNTVTEKSSEKTALEQEKATVGADQQLSYTLEIQEADTAIREANYNITLKEKEIQKMEEALKNLEVKSPVNGRVQSINEAGGTDNNGNPLPYITIIETGSWRIKGYVNENNASALTEGTAVIIRSRMDDTIWCGTISKIDWDNPIRSGSSDADEDGSGDVTSSSKYPFYVDLDSDEGLLLGQHIYIEPNYGQEEASQEQIKLPSYYINDTDSSPWVWAQDNSGRLEIRQLTLGELDEDLDTYVVESGLSAEDYIALPSEELQSGMICVEYDESAFEARDDTSDGEELPTDKGEEEE